ncbi:MAG: small ribosomal subunit Rsm22 family protein [bacterium]
MEIKFPKYLEAILKKYLKQTFYTSTRREVFSDRDFNAKDLKFFGEGAAVLSDLFTSERSDLPANYLNDKKLRAGFLLYFLPLNFCKAEWILEKLPPSFWKKHKIKILDLGCGPGTFTLAFTHYLTERDEGKKERRDLEILALDHNYHVLKDSQVLHEEMVKNLKGKGYPFRLNLAAKTFDLRRGKPDTLLKNDQYDLIVASNFMNEWHHSKGEEKVKFLEKIFQRHLSSDGYMILIDPALQRSTRELMEIRDIILKRKSLHVYAPCLHERPCPMLAASPRDWCHFYIDWEEPDFLKQLDRQLKNKNEYLKCSYMIFSSKALNEAEAKSLKKEKGPVHRVISNLMGSKGKSEVVLCGPSGRWHLTRLDKAKSPANRHFEELKRGDLVYLEKIPARQFTNDGNLKIEKEDKLEKL